MSNSILAWCNLLRHVNVALNTVKYLPKEHSTATKCSDHAISLSAISFLSTHHFFTHVDEVNIVVVDSRISSLLKYILLQK